MIQLDFGFCPKITETGRFEPVSGRFRFFFKNIDLINFLDKN